MLGDAAEVVDGWSIMCGPVDFEPGTAYFGPGPVYFNLGPVDFGPGPVDFGPGPVDFGPGPVSFIPGPVISDPSITSSVFCFRGTYSGRAVPNAIRFPKYTCSRHPDLKWLFTMGPLCVFVDGQDEN